jgi:hypothetical protein
MLTFVKEYPTISYNDNKYLDFRINELGIFVK